MDFEQSQEPRPDSSEANCMVASAENTLAFLLLSYLHATTGQMWNISGEFKRADDDKELAVDCKFKIALPRAAVGAEPTDFPFKTE